MRSVATLQAVSEPDPGLFGPDSVTWRVHGDASMALGGLRALLLQALHPLAMAGVAQHSGFREDPWGRLFRTAEYVGVTTFGTTTEARRAATRVRALHRRLSGIEPEQSVPYRVDDPELLRWVHVCEIDSFLTTARRSGLTLSDAEADAYLTEQLVSAELIGLDPSTVPSSRAEVLSYFASMRPALRLTGEARRAAVFVLRPPMPRWWIELTPARPGWTLLAGTAFGMLPRWARRMYRLPGLPTTDLVASLSGFGLRTALNAVPALRDGPHEKAAKERLGLR